jgi:hypothetical protein
VGSTLIQTNAAELNADVGVNVSVASTGSYAKPSNLTISANLNPQVTTGTQGFRGVGLGYFSAAGGGNGFTSFTGLALNPNGNLTLIENAASGASVAYSGSWTANQMHPVSYTIDARSGSVSNVLLDGQSKSFTTTAFTNAATTRAGFFVSAAVGGQKGLVDDFLLSGVATLTASAQPTVNVAGGNYSSAQTVSIRPRPPAPPFVTPPTVATRLPASCTLAQSPSARLPPCGRSRTKPTWRTAPS